MFFQILKKKVDSVVILCQNADQITGVVAPTLPTSERTILELMLFPFSFFNSVYRYFYEDRINFAIEARICAYSLPDLCILTAHAGNPMLYILNVNFAHARIIETAIKFFRENSENFYQNIG